MNEYQVTIVDQFKDKQKVKVQAETLAQAVDLVNRSINQALKQGKIYDILLVETVK